MKRARPGAKLLAEFTPALIAEALAARGLSEASLVADWRAIVGETIARHARPIELKWPPRAAKRDPEAPDRAGDPGHEGRRRLRARGSAQRGGHRRSGERASRLALRRKDRLPAGPAAAAERKARHPAGPERGG